MWCTGWQLCNTISWNSFINRRCRTESVFTSFPIFQPQSNTAVASHHSCLQPHTLCESVVFVFDLISVYLYTYVVAGVVPSDYQRQRSTFLVPVDLVAAYQHVCASDKARQQAITRHPCRLFKRGLAWYAWILDASLLAFDLLRVAPWVTDRVRLKLRWATSV